MFSFLSRKITDFLCTEEVIEKEDWELLIGKRKKGGRK